MSTHISNGPRGRRFLYELISASGERALNEALFWHPQKSAGPTIGWMQETLVDAWNSPGSGKKRAGEEPATPAEIAEIISSIELDPAAEQVCDALADAVVWAAYWQEPDRIDVALARPQITAALAEIDDVPLLSLLGPANDSSDGAETPGVFSVSWTGLDEGPRPAADILAQWHERTLRFVERAKKDRPDDPAAPWSGMWWSMPPSPLISTMGLTPSGVPEALKYVEDGPPRDRAIISRLTVGARNLYVIDQADDWAALCEKHPLDVTAAVRQDWYRATGRDGAWIIPNWLDVAREWDGVMLTKRAYLSAAGTIIKSGDAASMIAGWNPGETYWLTDAVEVHDQQGWKEDADGDWVPDN